MILSVNNLIFTKMGKTSNKAKLKLQIEVKSDSRVLGGHVGNDSF